MFGPAIKLKIKNKQGKGDLSLELGPPKSEAESIEKFVSWMNDNRVRQYLSLRYSISESSEKEWFSGQHKKSEDLVWLVYADGELIGSIGFHQIDLRDRQAEMGICLGNREFWGRGIASAIEAAVIDYAFENIVAGGLNKITARVYEGNEASKRAIEKAGMTTVGVFKKHIWKNGHWHDVWVGEILQKEWSEKRPVAIKNARISALELYPGCD